MNESDYVLFGGCQGLSEVDVRMAAEFPFGPM